MKSIRIFCANLSSYHLCAPGTTLFELAQQVNIRLSSGIVAALVDNKLKDLSYAIYETMSIRFIDLTHPEGMRTYQRSLSFLCQKAVHDVLPEYRLSIQHSVSKGLFGEITKDGQPAREALLQKVENRMRELVEKDLPFVRVREETAKAIRLFENNDEPQKALLQETRGRFYTTIYYLDNYPDHFYGPLVYSTGCLKVFQLNRYEDGMLLRMPQAEHPDRLEPMPSQPKMFRVFQQHKEWNAILGANGIGSINKTVQQNYSRQLIQVAEALQESEYAKLAAQIRAEHERIRLVLIAGPSSSGKTTTAKRLSIQVKVAGLNPVAIELDNYFVNREDTPRDAAGHYDFETIEALDLPFLNQQLHDLLQGREIEVPRFDFIEGKRFFNGQRLKVKPDDILILEGIHGLNPKLTAGVPESNKFKIYASALTSISMDENNRIPTTDNRLIRRIVRDAKTRGYSARETIARWQSVRRGEDKYIFPFQEHADIMFNSALLFELSVLRRHAEPLLRNIHPVDESYSEAVRLLKFLSYFEQISPEDEATIPPTSVLREFIGGSSFTY
jgi:uridine kinase